MRTQWRTKKEPIALHHVAGSSHVHKDWVTLIQTSSWSLHHEFSTWSSENLCFFFFVRQSALCWDTPTYAHIGARSMQTYMYIVYIIRYIYIYVIDIIFGPLKRFTNSSRWSFYIYIYIYIIYLYIYIYPCPATCPATWRCTSSNSPNSWGPGQSQETFFCAVGGTHFPKGWTCETRISWQLWRVRNKNNHRFELFFWGINHGSGGNRNWFPPRLLPLYKTAF